MRLNIIINKLNTISYYNKEVIIFFEAKNQIVLAQLNKKQKLH